jgi:hypothetical protein
VSAADTAWVLASAESTRFWPWLLQTGLFATTAVNAQGANEMGALRGHRPAAVAGRDAPAESAAPLDAAS